MARLRCRESGYGGHCGGLAWCLKLLLLVSIVVVQGSVTSSVGVKYTTVARQCQPRKFYTTTVWRNNSQSGLKFITDKARRFGRRYRRSHDKPVLSSLMFGSQCRLHLTKVSFQAYGLCKVKIVRREVMNGSTMAAAEDFVMRNWTEINGGTWKDVPVTGFFEPPVPLYSPPSRNVSITFNATGACPWACMVEHILKTREYTNVCTFIADRIGPDPRTSILRPRIRPRITFFATDVDECLQGYHQCSGDTKCVNNIGSYRCETVTPTPSHNTTTTPIRTLQGLVGGPASSAIVQRTSAFRPTTSRTLTSSRKTQPSLSPTQPVPNIEDDSKTNVPSSSRIPVAVLVPILALLVPLVILVSCGVVLCHKYELWQSFSLFAPLANCFEAAAQSRSRNGGETEGQQLHWLMKSLWKARRHDNDTASTASICPAICHDQLANSPSSARMAEDDLNQVTDTQLHSC